MTFQESIDVLREEVQVLAPTERQQVEGLLDSGEGLRIVSALEAHEQSGALGSPRFRQALEALYWSSR
jgi:hypothetical protein